MRKIPFLFVCALGVLTLAVKESPADSLLFSRAMETPAPRGDATDVSARFSDASPGGFSLGLSDLIVGNAGMAGNDAMLAGMALGMTSPGTVRAISAVLAAGSRLGAGGGGGGGAAGGGGLAVAARDRLEVRFLRVTTRIGTGSDRPQIPGRNSSWASCGIRPAIRRPEFRALSGPVVVCLPIFRLDCSISVVPGTGCRRRSVIG